MTRRCGPIRRFLGLCPAVGIMGDPGKRPRAYDYTVVEPNGEIAKTKIPTWWTPFEVAERLAHSLVFMSIPAKSTVWTKNADLVSGPAVVLVRRNEIYLVPSLPKNDGHAYSMWRQLVDQGYKLGGATYPPREEKLELHS